MAPNSVLYSRLASDLSKASLMPAMTSARDFVAAAAAARLSSRSLAETSGLPSSSLARLSTALSFHLRERGYASR